MSYGVFNYGFGAKRQNFCFCSWVVKKNEPEGGLTCGKVVFHKAEGDLTTVVGGDESRANKKMSAVSKVPSFV